MTEQVLSRRSSLLYDRPLPTRLGPAEVAVNNNPGDPGLYFADNTASPSTGLIKVGPTFIGSTAPNLLPTGYTSLSKGESWLDTVSTQIFKIYDGSTWQTTKAVASIFAGKPSNPVNGQLHYDKSLSTMYIYDSTSSSWLAI
jgi:hypothetical protein